MSTDRLIFTDPIHITTDVDRATLTVGTAIPGPGRRLTITHHGITLHVDLDDAAQALLVDTLSRPHPMERAADALARDLAAIRAVDR